MTDPSGDKLYVCLPAAQARRRLKGFGHGVRKVHSAGRNRALVIHTATGRNLTELRGKFADVGCFDREEEMTPPVEQLRNIGKVSGRWLREIGVGNEADLQRVGAVWAYQQVRRRRTDCTLNLLWALAGAVADRDWRDLTADERQSLLRQVEA